MAVIRRIYWRVVWRLAGYAIGELYGVQASGNNLA
jgi:hypothetical protein